MYIDSCLFHHDKYIGAYSGEFDHCLYAISLKIGSCQTHTYQGILFFTNANKFLICKY